MTCDIASPQGQGLIRSLALHSHVFVENYKVGDMSRYGLDYATLKAINPKLVYCSITGFGQTGPYRERAGYDFAVQAMGGLMSVTGERDDAGGGPQKVGLQWQICSPACTQQWLSWRLFAMPKEQALGSTLTWRF